MENTEATAVGRSLLDPRRKGRGRRERKKGTEVFSLLFKIGSITGADRVRKVRFFAGFCASLPSVDEYRGQNFRGKYRGQKSVVEVCSCVLN